MGEPPGQSRAQPLLGGTRRKLGIYIKTRFWHELRVCLELAIPPTPTGTWQLKNQRVLSLDPHCDLK